RQGGHLSGGEQQMLTIARTLMGNPQLLLLDEPSEGLAPIVVDHLRDQIARLKREGLTILLAEQNTEFSLSLADRVYVLEKASTITQQLAKNLWLSPSRNPARKAKEAMLTWELEKALSKRRILELYLNVIEFGPGVYGAEAASRRYFDKPAAELSEEEAAQLA